MTDHVKGDDELEIEAKREEARAVREEFYDKAIAPLLLKLADMCKENGMSMVACVGNDADTYCTRGFSDGNLNPSMRIVTYGSRCNGNLDILMMAIEKDAEKHGHNSVYLSFIEQYRKMVRSGV
ncbi:MAG: hypothetical protein ACREGB_01680 [Candidatus Saccharimonadales bacterium]